MFLTSRLLEVAFLFSNEESGVVATHRNGVLSPLISLILIKTSYI